MDRVWFWVAGFIAKLGVVCGGQLLGVDEGFCVAFCRASGWAPTAGSCWAAAIAERSRMATSACMNRLRHPELSIASLAFSRIIRLFIFPPALSERDTPHNLKGISLDCGQVREFLE